MDFCDSEYAWLVGIELGIIYQKEQACVRVLLNGKNSLSTTKVICK